MKNNNNSNHENVKLTLKIVGGVCLSVGIICSVIGFINFFSTIATGEFPKLFFMLFIGFPLIGVGASLLGFAFRREIMTYTKNESVPVINQMGGEITPAVKDIASAIKTTGNENTTCPECGSINDKDDKFCKNCGRKLHNTCPGCGAEVASDCKYCPQCGCKIQ